MASPSPAATSAVPPLRPATSNASPFSASAWAFLRAGSGQSLAGGGQLGGSQAGIRLSYALAGRTFGVFGRASAPLLQSDGKEAALGIELRPFGSVALSVTAERRIALDRGGRSAFAIGLIGGVDQAALPARFKLDAYGQAGIVGARSRDAYIEGAARIERRVISVDTLDIGFGAGVWGGAQPDVSRLDVGPQLVIRAPVAGRALRLNLEWRQRVAGEARPGSGVALTLAGDF